MQVDTRTTIIHGHQGAGKTLFGVLIASWFFDEIRNPRIYWNVWIYKNENLITQKIYSISNLEDFQYSPIPWVVIFDEMGLNFNSKNHTSDKNKSLSNFFFLVRKFNLSSIFISQRFGSVPVDMRELADYIFELNIIPRKWLHPIFSITRQSTDAEWILQFEEEYHFDIIKYLQIFWFSYNTLESSIIS